MASSPTTSGSTRAAPPPFRDRSRVLAGPPRRLAPDPRSSSEGGRAAKAVLRRALGVASLALLAAFPLGGCIAAAVGAGMGFVISQEVLPNDVHTAQLALDVDPVWQTTRSVLSDLSSEPIDFQDFPRVATGRVEGAEVRVEVQAYDLDRTIVTVQARKYLVSRSDVANRVLQRILDRLER